ncbi:maleylpyruvate isomerase family mycothiol-dependent enzyme [Streptomyces atratus]|uniref:maleylpyruvate isomerase family mycothiol-dependent enzyme n=1 Tax=Streptomyces atratus TaxID=1893 RepID=UPI0033E3CD53
MHADETDIDADLVRRLVSGRFPQWADLPVERVASGGTVNAVYRLGDALSVRLPLTEGGAKDVEREQRWLPELALALPVVLLRLIDEQSTAFRAAVASAPSLDVQVPTCPEWTLFDLIQHLGGGDRFWAAIVGAGPADAPPAEATAARAAVAAPREREALPAWLAESTQLLLSALGEAGPDRGCWTWWGTSQSPQNSGGVARHRVQETAVHVYDAQITLGAPQPLLAEAALDGVEEFLSTCCATPSAWPHKPTAFDFHATEGHSWRLTVDGDGARSTRLPALGTTPATAAEEGPDTAGASVRGTASELVLFMYDRIPADFLQIDGDAGLIDLLRAWEPEE